MGDHYYYTQIFKIKPDKATESRFFFFGAEMLKSLILIFIFSIWISNDADARCFTYIFGGMADASRHHKRMDHIEARAKANGCLVLKLHDLSSASYRDTLKKFINENEFDPQLDKLHISITDHGSGSNSLVAGRKNLSPDSDSHSSSNRYFDYNVGSFLNDLDELLPSGAKVSYDTSICWPPLHEAVLEMKSEFKNIKKICGVTSVHSNKTSSTRSISNTFGTAGWSALQKNNKPQIWCEIFSCDDQSSLDHFYSSGIIADSTNAKKTPQLLSHAFIEKWYHSIDSTDPSSMQRFRSDFLDIDTIDDIVKAKHKNEKVKNCDDCINQRDSLDSFIRDNLKIIHGLTTNKYDHLPANVQKVIAQYLQESYAIDKKTIAGINLKIRPIQAKYYDFIKDKDLYASNLVNTAMQIPLPPELVQLDKKINSLRAQLSKQHEEAYKNEFDSYEDYQKSSYAKTIEKLQKQLEPLKREKELLLAPILSEHADKFPLLENFAYKHLMDGIFILHSQSDPAFMKKGIAGFLRQEIDTSIRDEVHRKCSDELASLQDSKLHTLKKIIKDKDREKEFLSDPNISDVLKKQYGEIRSCETGSVL